MIIGPRLVHAVTVIDGAPRVADEKRAQIVGEFTVRIASITPTGMHFESVAFVSKSGDRWFVDVYDRRTRGAGGERRIFHVLDRSFEITAPPEGRWDEARDEDKLRPELVAAMRK